jgi:hypothetical protein
MTKIFSHIFYALVLVASFAACSEMNDLHDEYLAGGERIYIGKIDSLKTFAGDERVKLRFWAADPRIETVGFYWFPGNDSMFVEIDHSSPTDSFDVYIGGPLSTKTIGQGNYTLKVITRDGNNHFSVPYEKILNIYGDKFRATLSNRVLRSIAFEETEGLLSLFFSGPVNEKERGIEIFYTDREGEAKTLQVSDSEITSPLAVTNIDQTKGVSYRTIFLPDPNAIDTFYAETTSVEITQIVNVALNKAVMTSDDLNASFPGANAVDGVIADASRWVSTASGEHWIEIDLGQEYAISSFETWNGSSGQVNTPIPDFKFQAEVNGEWVNIVDVTGNSIANYKTTFPEVTTAKVRFVTNTQTRLFEIAVYTTIRY